MNAVEGLELFSTVIEGKIKTSANVVTFEEWNVFDLERMPTVLWNVSNADAFCVSRNKGYTYSLLGNVKTKRLF